MAGWTRDVRSAQVVAPAKAMDGIWYLRDAMRLETTIVLVPKRNVKRLKRGCLVVKLRYGLLFVVLRGRDAVAQAPRVTVQPGQGSPSFSRPPVSAALGALD